MKAAALRRRMGSGLLGVIGILWLATLGGSAATPGFKPSPDGGFQFDTGVLRGRLRIGGKSLGLQEVTNVATRQRLDRSNGLLSHYRVFTTGHRYGGGAWDWPSTARLLDDAAVEVSWPAADDRPFSMTAVYRWRDASTVDLETTVKAVSDLRGFETFIASYFHERFTNTLVATGPATAPTWVRTTKAEGDWQIFPRDAAAEALIRDGRWKLEPNPVDWTMRPAFARPLVRRRAPTSGLSGILMAPTEECFAVALPHETEGHYSAYLSLFGRDLAAGQTARARVRLVIAVAKTDAAVVVLSDEAAKNWGP